MKHKKLNYLYTMLLTGLIGTAPFSASAYNLHTTDSSEVNLDIEAVAGIFMSEETYGNTESSPSWREGYIKYGLSGKKIFDNELELFATANLLSSASWGDGDAAGLTTGDESDTDFEDLYFGVRNDQFELSIGSQNIVIGDGFIINGDSLNMGEGLDGLAPGFSANRGGAYWLAARKSFDKTIVARIGGETGLRSDIFWIESDNPAQASMELAGVNVEYVRDIGTFAAMYIQGLDVDKVEAEFWGYEGRDGQKNLSVRYQGNAGIENLFLSAEYTNQEDGETNKDINAWYVEAGWSFADLSWTPSLNYRFTSYEEGYDPLFFGFSRGYGTWFQGEVAANYAGPFATGSDIHFLELTAHPAEMLTVGAGYFVFNDRNGVDIDNANFDVGGKELDIWAEWVVSENLILSPVLGFYKPDNANNVQSNSNTNTYFQMIAVVLF